MHKLAPSQNPLPHPVLTNNNRPPRSKIQLIPPKKELLILIPHARLHIMIIQHHRFLPGIIKHPLPTRSINISMRSINQRPPVLRNAVFAVPVSETACRGGRATDADAVFFAGGFELVGSVAAGAAAEEEVVVVGAVDEPAELVGAFDVFASSVLGEVVVGGVWEDV